MEGVEDYLRFTIETGEDYGDQWLPTLDMSLYVSEDNKVQYRFYEKPTASNLTVQKRTAIGEDSKQQIVSNDLVRRLQNNSEDLGAWSKRNIVDQYAQKLLNSGYGMDQVRKIICNGIKGYEGKRRKCIKNGWKLHRSSKDSLGARCRKKLLGKSSWFKKKKKPEEEGEKTVKKGGRRGEQTYTDRELETKTILFVEQSPEGGLAKKMREVLRSMEPALGFRIKVVERTGQTLGSKFSQTSGSEMWQTGVYNV